MTSGDPLDRTTERRRHLAAGWALVLATAIGGAGLHALTRDGGGPTESGGPVTTTTVAAPVAPPSSGLSAPDPDQSSVDRSGTESFEIFHAVPGTVVDAYIDGELVAPGFVPGTLAGPLPVSDAGRTLELFARADDPAPDAADRSDPPLLGVALEPDGAGALVAFPGPAGSLRLEHFGYDLEPVAVGRARLVLQHVGATGPVTVFVDDLPGTTLEPGGAVTVDVGPGPHRIEVSDAAGETLLEQAVDTPEGELTSTWIRGGNGEPYTTSIRRIDGL